MGGADTPVREVAKKMRDKGIGCLPVGENDKFIGMITDRDVTCRAGADGLDLSKVKACDVMSKGVTWCFEDQSDVEATKLMEKKNIRHLPVLNRAKRIVGMVSRRSRTSVRIAYEGAPSHGRASCLAQRKGPTGALAHAV